MFRKCNTITKQTVFKKHTTESFIGKAKKIHGDRYDYSKTEYVDYNTPLTIICPEHGEFYQKPNSHLQGCGCKKCNYQLINKDRKLTTEEFIKRARDIHGNKYDYSKVEYINNKTKVCIICHEHGEFWQTPGNHINGAGCPDCQNSRGENECANILLNKKISYIREKKFEWLGNQKLDFYLPDFNIGIEYQGIQHFEPRDFAGKGKKWAENVFKQCIIRDKNKKRLCEENNVQLFYITYKENIEYKLNEILKNI